MNLAGMKILLEVTAKLGENPNHRKGKGFSATFISRELAGPKSAPNWTRSKGKQVNIPAQYKYLR